MKKSEDIDILSQLTTKLGLARVLWGIGIALDTEIKILTKDLNRDKKISLTKIDTTFKLIDELTENRDYILALANMKAKEENRK